MNIDTRKEVEAENNIENSASGQDLFENLLNTGNENAFREILGNQDGQKTEDDGEDPGDLLGGFEKKSSPAPEKKGAEKAENAGKTGAEIDAPAVNEYGKKDPEAEIYPGERPAKPEFYEDPGGPDLIEFLGREPNKKKKTDIPFDLVTNMPRIRRKGKNGRLEKRIKARKKDREKLEAEQKKVAGLNFSLHKLPERNKAGGFSRFLSNLAIAAGSTIGKSFNRVGALFARMFSSSFRRRYRSAHSSDWKNPLIRQNKRIHDVIPGWNGEKFQPGPDGKDDILADFRRIPTVWSALTAAQAEDSDGKPLAPKITIYVRKGGEEDKTLEGFDPGHAGIGIEYSRYSRRSNRYERYNLRYGFYPANRDNKKAGSLSMVSSAIIPGKLKDESGYVYTIRRTYPATAKQVNRILKASETYADKGY
ncbi:MAG: hypothetical protein IKP86_08705, partial [Anaerolineaceae bacterium]|nr:hypothetical protein [Anaerolineaceae bacterium]